jgi:16S rRNA (adenine1518-N6/adenine1519-N6)-dimethyltransferase
MNLKERTETFLSVSPGAGLFEQHFLIDEKIVDELIQLAEIEDSDTILEIGAGIGNITEKLAEKAKKVIAVEIDDRFRDSLSKLPSNVQILYDDALQMIKHVPCTKTVANMPYLSCEPILRQIITLKQIKLCAWIVPRTFIEVVEKHPIYSSFFSLKKTINIEKEAFVPEPNTTSAIICFERLPDYVSDKQFITQHLWFQKDKKLQNGLREAVILLYKQKHGSQMTKKQAKENIQKLKIHENASSMLIGKMHPDLIADIAAKIEKLSI